MRLLFGLFFIVYSFIDTQAIDDAFNESLLVYFYPGQDSSATVDSLYSADSLHVQDSTMASDSLGAVTKPDTLKPLAYYSINHNELYRTNLSKNKINLLDYRYTGNILGELPFGYLRDFGWYGQVNESYFMGLGNGSISYLQDGIPINNRLLNSLNLNLFQSEYLDSLEIMPLPIGFYYNQFNNPITVNFITRDKIALHPYTRIRFYQAPEEEGFIDAIFNAYLMNKLNFTFEFTNGAVDKLYKSSNYSKWLISGKLRYMPNNIFNIIGSYTYSESQTRLNGGVDLSGIDSGSSQTAIDDYLYDPLTAYVNYETRYQKTTRHNFAIKILAKIDKHTPTDLTFYHQSYLTEFRQNEDTLSTTIPVIFDNNKYTVTGFSLRQQFSYQFIELEANANYENINYAADILNENPSINKFSLGGRIKLSLLNNRISPSVFIKQTQYENTDYSGFGADLQAIIAKGIIFYSGLSHFQQPLTPIEKQYLDDSVIIDKKDITALQGGIQYKFGEVSGSVSVFNFKNDNALTAAADLSGDSLVVVESGIFTTQKVNNVGINLTLDFPISFLHFHNSASYYYLESDKRNYEIPEFTLNGGIYYVDTLFNDNLKLKTGINYKFYGIQDYSFYEFERGISTNNYSDSNLSSISYFTKTMSPSFQFDFFLAGKIQDAAIVYLVVENLLNEKYFLVPYYPMFGTGFRFGLAWEFLD